MTQFDDKNTDEYQSKEAQEKDNEIEEKAEGICSAAIVARNRRVFDRKDKASGRRRIDRKEPLSAVWSNEG